MKFGIMLPHYRQAASTEEITRFAKEAEDMGYDSAWVTDQIIVPNSEIDRFGPVYYECLTVLAYVAGITNRIRLGSSVIVLPYRNPIYLAKIASTIDSLSNGRLMLGVGVGGVESEFREISVPWEDRGERSDESLRIIKELWTNDAPSIQTKNYQFSDIQFYPKGAQKPHLPLWIGGNTRRALRRVVEFGDVWHPVRQPPDVMAQMVPRLRCMAERAGRDPEQIGIAIREPLKIVSDSSRGSDSWPMLGTVDKLIGNLSAFRDAGVDYLVMDTFYGIPELHGETADDMLATMERFAKEVMPEFPDS